MSHNHILYDSDPHFKIDADTRKITNESTRKTSLIQHDHNSERFTFEIKRYVEGHDLLSCNIVEIHYINVESNTKLTHVGVYSVDDLQTKEGDEDTLVCSWKVGRNATRLVGQLQFILRFSCVDDTGNVVYVWNTGVYNGITISSGIYNIDSDSDNPVPAYNFVTTINGDILKFFVGTQAQYDDLSDSAKQNLFAIITDEKINPPLIAQYTLESTKSIADIMNNFSGTFNINHFNRIPVIGDTFYIIGSSTIDDVSFTMTALITGFTGDGLYATFTAIEVVPIKASHAQDAITLYGGTPIYSGDLNNYKAVGNYFIPSDDDATKVANAPLTLEGYALAGQLKVVSGTGEKGDPSSEWNYLIQIYLTHRTEMFIRRGYQLGTTSVSWSDWKQFAGSGSHATSADNATCDSDGNIITDTYVKLQELVDGTVSAFSATYDSAGNHISYTYAKKDDLLDGSVVPLKATSAEHATNADNATHATSADESAHATNADNATHAFNATSANNAVSANKAERVEAIAQTVTMGGTNGVEINLDENSLYAISAGSFTCMMFISSDSACSSSLFFSTESEYSSNYFYYLKSESKLYVCGIKKDENKVGHTYGAPKCDKHYTLTIVKIAQT